jgi:hypothetical protein
MRSVFTEEGPSAPDNSRKVFWEEEVTSLRLEINALKDRIVRLEEERDAEKAEVAALRRKVETLNEVVVPFEQELDAEDAGVGRDAHKKKPGRHPKVTYEALFEYRDLIIKLLEPMWPDLAPKLYAAGNAEQVLTFLTRAFESTSLAPAGVSALKQRLLSLGSAKSLYEFKESKRFRRKPPKATVIMALDVSDQGGQEAAGRLPPRQIAAAMAGVPDIDWRTSLDRCSKMPSSQWVQSRDHFAQMYNLPAYWIQVVPKVGSHEAEPGVIGPFFTETAANVRANELEIAARTVRVLIGKPDEPPAPLPIQAEKPEQRNADNEIPTQHLIGKPDEPPAPLPSQAEKPEQRNADNETPSQQ